MDDEDNKRYPPSSYGINSQKFPLENVNYPQNIGNSYSDDDDSDDEEEEENINNAQEEDDDDEDDDDDDGGNGVQRISKDDYEYGDDDEGEDNNFSNSQKHPKKRKLKTLLSNYEFAPRVPPPSSSASKPSYGGRNPLTDWTEHETFILLEAWGDRFLKQGRKSLRSEEWQEVAERVSQESKIERTDTQCRNRLDTLKKKYKKEKAKPADVNKWIYFKKMDSLLSPPPSSSVPHQTGLSCGVDSGEFIFMNPKVYLSSSNGLDEMRDSPGNSESWGIGEDESVEGFDNRKNGAASFKLLADSIQKFSDIYQKIESSKRQQMVELEKMRMDFHRDLEFQKRQILERGQAEIEKIRQGEEDGDDDNDNDNDVSAENVSG